MGIFDGLSEKQKEAVETIDEDLEIIACAGAGKTGVVTRRIVNILKQTKDITPANIVAFTFTEKAAEELKSRIYKYAKKELGSTVGFAEMYIGTIHGFCLKMLQEYIPQFQSFFVLDEIKTKLFIGKNYFECGMKDLDLKMYRETGLFLSTMSMLNESWETRDSWDKTTFDAVEKYKELLYSQHYFDYSLILREMLEQMQKNDEFRKRITSRVKFLTVDEYQDTNPIQEKLIQLIKNGGSNLCIVGDDDQTIYQFRGSDSENILTFKERYGVEKYIVLDTDYRSSEAIVDIAQRVIINNNRRLSKNMVSGAKFKYEEGDTIYREFEDIEQECDFIAGRIKALHESGVKYSEMAVLLRKKKFGEYFSETFDKYGIPYIVEGVNALFSTAECQASRGIFRYLNGEISMTDLFNLWKEVNYELDLKDLSDALTYLSGIDVKKMKYYGEFVLQEIYHNFLRLIYITEQEENAITEVILYNLGKFSQVINDFESINFATLPKNKLARFCKFMEYTASDYYPEGHLDNTYIRPDAVNIMTVHQSKGLEYTAVFVPELSKNNFPAAGVGGKNVWHIINRDWIQNSERFNSGIEEERRLFYVAVTRAKKYLCLTRCPYRRDKKISTFLVEAKESPYMLSYDDKMEYSGKQLPPMVEEKSAINLNFSILQDFFDCAYRFKLSMFYGFVQPIAAAMGYGNAVHNIVRNIHKKYLDGENLTREDVQAIVEDTFYLPYANSKMEQNMLESAKKSVDMYFEKNKADFKNIEMAEADIELDMGDGVKVNGRIDLVKHREISGEEKITIVDFKTADRDVTQCLEAEQLKIYALGYQELTGKSADYLEILNLDKVESERVRVTEGLTETVAKDIRNAAQNIRENKLDRKCSKEKCSACYLNYLCLSKEEKKTYVE